MIHLRREKGMTLLELLVTMAIVALLTYSGISLFSLISAQKNTSAATVAKEAIRQFTIYALTDEGAELTFANGALHIVTLGANQQQASYQLPAGTTISLNGQPFSCLILTFQGVPYNSVAVPAGIPACTSPNPTIPLTWSISNGTTAVTFS